MTLDTALASFDVQHQAYFSGSFVGNHVHRALKVYITILSSESIKVSVYLQLQNIDTLCDTVPEVAQKHCPSLLNKARDIQTKFKQVLILFKRCHDICDGNSVSDAQITQLGKLFTILQFVNSTFFYTLQRVTSLNSCPSINKTSLRRPCSLGSKSGTQDLA